MRINLPASPIRNLQRFTSSDRARGNLRGICVESSGVCVAMDGHTLLACDTNTFPFPSAAGECQLPDVDIVLMLSTNVPAWAHVVQIEHSGRDATEVVHFVSYNQYGAEKQRKTVTADIVRMEDGQYYPKWRQVIPSWDGGIDRPIANVNADYAGRFALDAQPYDKGATRGARFVGTRDSAAVLVFPSDPAYFGLLMPLNAKSDRAYTLPAWCVSRPTPMANAIPEAA